MPQSPFEGEYSLLLWHLNRAAVWVLSLDYATKDCNTRSCVVINTATWSYLSSGSSLKGFQDRKSNIKGLFKVKILLLKPLKNAHEFHISMPSRHWLFNTIFFYSETFLLRYKTQYREINDAEDLQGLARSNRTNGRSLLQSFTAPTVRSD